MLKLKILFLVLSFFYISDILSSNEYYYYNPNIDKGSEAFFNPASMWLNGGFDILRNGAHDKRLTNQYYRTGFKYVMKSLSQPIATIKDIGWSKFFEQEFPNFKLKRENLNFMPNFPIHTIGEGMRYVKVSEWYHYHNYPYPKTLGLITSITYQLMNETLEQGDLEQRRVDPVADVHFYNNLGFILFSLDSVNRFFSETFVINDWGLQPMYNPTNDFVENAGEQYMGKLHIKNDYSLFCYWGMDFLIGTSKEIGDGYSVSIGIGQVANRIETIIVNDVFTPVASTIDFAFGIFYDYRNSLLANAHLSFNKNFFRLKSNIYPGLWEIGRVKPGLFTQLTVRDKEVMEFMLGFSIDKLPFGLVFGESKLNKEIYGED